MIRILFAARWRGRRRCSRTSTRVRTGTVVAFRRMFLGARNRGSQIARERLSLCRRRRWAFRERLGTIPRWLRFGLRLLFVVVVVVVAAGTHAAFILKGGNQFLLFRFGHVVVVVFGSRGCGGGFWLGSVVVVFQPFRAPLQESTTRQGSGVSSSVRRATRSSHRRRCRCYLYQGVHSRHVHGGIVGDVGGRCSTWRWSRTMGLRGGVPINAGRIFGGVVVVVGRAALFALFLFRHGSTMLV